MPRRARGAFAIIGDSSYPNVTTEKKNFKVWITRCNFFFPCYGSPMGNLTEGVSSCERFLPLAILVS